MCTGKLSVRCRRNSAPGRFLCREFSRKAKTTIRKIRGQIPSLTTRDAVGEPDRTLSGAPEQAGPIHGCSRIARKPLQWLRAIREHPCDPCTGPAVPIRFANSITSYGRKPSALSAAFSRGFRGFEQLEACRRRSRFFPRNPRNRRPESGPDDLPAHTNFPTRSFAGTAAV